ncbi:MAG: hypothetical protein Q8N44_01700 [Rubrivivax sp.]|nr:hypothetical protein [Rubrivivax sp.]MDP3082392.1 hypothetical protein [Rubrivivax sp.]
MNSLQLTVPVPDSDPALVTLPQPLTLQALACLEQAIAGTLRMLRRDLGGDASAGVVEYASWLRLLRTPRP